MYNTDKTIPYLFKSYFISNRNEAIRCGDRMFQYYKINILRTPFPLVPSEPKNHDYRTCPRCQHVRKKIINLLQERYDKFPDCCEWHKNLKDLKEFDKNDYKNSHIQCADSIIYCVDFVLNHQFIDNWQYEIKEYLKLAVFRFGCMPEGYGSALFIETFNNQLRYLITEHNDIKEDVKCYVNEILDELIRPSDRKDPIKELLHIYNNWLDSFPFDFPEFLPLKKDFSSLSPIMIVQVKDGYSRLATNRELIEWLNEKSKELFRKMRESKGISSAMVFAYESSIEGKLLDIDEAKLINAYVEEESVYLETLTKWLEIQKKRISLMRNSLPKIENDEASTSYKEAQRRISKFKKWIEYQNGCIFLSRFEKVKEKDLQILFKAVCTMSDSIYRFDREVSNGRGSVDFLVSKGSSDSTLIEFKLASNTNLENNLKYQDEIYMRCCETDKALKVVFCFNTDELTRVNKLKLNLGILDNKEVIIIDCRCDKNSASKVKCISEV